MALFESVEEYRRVMGMRCGKFEGIIVGDKFEILVTGMVTRFVAEVIGKDFRDGRLVPRLRILGNDAWKNTTLKEGDYILVERITDKETLEAAEVVKKKKSNRLLYFIFGLGLLIAAVIFVLLALG